MGLLPENGIVPICLLGRPWPAELLSILSSAASPLTIAAPTASEESMLLLMVARPAFCAPAEVPIRQARRIKSNDDSGEEP